MDQDGGKLLDMSQLDEYNSDTWSDYDAFADYGDDKLARAVLEPTEMRRLIADGVPVTASSIISATRNLKLEALRILIDAEGNVNRTLDDADRLTHNLNSQAAQEAGGMLRFEEDSSQWYPITYATYSTAPRTLEERQLQRDIITALLDGGADVHAKYLQPLEGRRSKVSQYPGEAPVEQPESDEVGVARSYGLRSVLHAILEDGRRVDPILKHASLRLDVNSRDPSGRTLFLSMCRSSLGADAAIDSTILDADRWKQDGLPDPLAVSTTRLSLFNAISEHGPDMLAVDHDGNNALHHLLESRDDNNYDFRPPKIRDALLHTLKACPELVNQPNKAGDYPLHAALQRIRFYHRRDRWRETADLDCLIDDLLAGGADPRARDSRGNTVLHYAANEGLAEVILGEQTRRRFKLFIDAGVDINLRNLDGRSALELFVDDDGSRARDRFEYYSHLVKIGEVHAAEPQKVDDEVFDLFDKAGVNWKDVNADGQTPMHLAAKHVGVDNIWTRAAAWAKMLYAKGVNPVLKDKDGRSAVDIASFAGNESAIKDLSSVS